MFLKELEPCMAKSFSMKILLEFSQVTFHNLTSVYLANYFRVSVFYESVLLFVISTYSLHRLKLV